MPTLKEKLEILTRCANELFTDGEHILLAVAPPGSTIVEAVRCCHDDGILETLQTNRKVGTDEPLILKGH